MIDQSFLTLLDDTTEQSVIGVMIRAYKYYNPTLGASGSHWPSNRDLMKAMERYSRDRHMDSLRWREYKGASASEASILKRTN